MTEILTYRRCVLRVLSPWFDTSDDTHQWSARFNVSGAGPLPAADIEATALDLWEPIRQLTGVSSWLHGWSWYDPGNKVATAEQVYTPTQYPGGGTAWMGGGVHCYTEAAALCESHAGFNSRGKPVYLRHYVHDIPLLQNHGRELPQIFAPGPFDKWNNGAGPHQVVPVRPSNGQQGGPWYVVPAAHTHQMRRGKKRLKKGYEIVPIPVPVP